MKTKNILFIIFFIIMLFPIFGILQMNALDAEASVEEAISASSFLQLSIWASWLFMVSIAVYYKWTRQSDLFFIMTYIFVAAGFVIYGFLMDWLVSEFEIRTRYGAEYPVATFTTIRNIGAALALTAFLQLAVFWFTRRWHRK